jgi:hypothetical protein
MDNNTNPPVNANQDGVPEVQPEGEAAPPNPEVVSFYNRYNKAMLAWAKEKGNTNFPIAEVPTFDRNGVQTGTKLVWLNRATRSKLRKNKK